MASTAGKPQRVQLRRTKGWRMPANTVRVDRSTCWGNPYPLSGHCDRAHVVELFRAYLARPQQAALVARARQKLRGKHLACWCPLDAPCHADVLLEVANQPEVRS